MLAILPFLCGSKTKVKKKMNLKKRFKDNLEQNHL